MAFIFSTRPHFKMKNIDCNLHKNIILTSILTYKTQKTLPQKENENIFQYPNPDGRRKIKAGTEEATQGLTLGITTQIGNLDRPDRRQVIQNGRRR